MMGDQVSIFSDISRSDSLISSSLEARTVVCDTSPGRTCNFWLTSCACAESATRMAKQLAESSLGHFLLVPSLREQFNVVRLLFVLIKSPKGRAPAIGPEEARH